MQRYFPLIVNKFPTINSYITYITLGISAHIIFCTWHNFFNLFLYSLLIRTPHKSRLIKSIKIIIPNFEDLNKGILFIVSHAAIFIMTAITINIIRKIISFAILCFLTAPLLILPVLPIITSFKSPSLYCQ